MALGSDTLGSGPLGYAGDGPSGGAGDALQLIDGGDNLLLQTGGDILLLQAATGGGGFQTAWARNSNVILGATG